MINKVHFRKEKESYLNGVSILHKVIGCPKMIEGQKLWTRKLNFCKKVGEIIVSTFKLSLSKWKVYSSIIIYVWSSRSIQNFKVS